MRAENWAARRAQSDRRTARSRFSKIKFKRCKGGARAKNHAQDAEKRPLCVQPSEQADASGSSRQLACARVRSKRAETARRRRRLAAAGIRLRLGILAKRRRRRRAQIERRLRPATPEGFVSVG